MCLLGKSFPLTETILLRKATDVMCILLTQTQTWWYQIDKGVFYYCDVFYLLIYLLVLQIYPPAFIFLTILSGKHLLQGQECKYVIPRLNTLLLSMCLSISHNLALIEQPFIILFILIVSPHSD